MAEQRMQAVAEQVARRFVSGGEEHRALRQQLLVRRELAAPLCREEQTGQVLEFILFARPSGKQLSKIGRHVEQRVLRAERGLEPRGQAPHERYDVVRPTYESRLLGLGYAEHLRDHARGQRMRKLSDEVELARRIA